MKVAKITSTSPIEQFIVTSGALRVTDPCYDLTVWCSGKLDRVKNGTWNAHVGFHQNEYEKSQTSKPSEYVGRVAYLHICHDSVSPQEIGEMDNGVWHLVESFEVGVDSGQAGLFDLEYYQHQFADKGRRKTFYDTVCRLTCDMDGTGVDRKFGVIEKGAAASSGYGDGSYDCYIRHDEDMRVVEAVIVFIHEDDGQ